MCGIAGISRFDSGVVSKAELLEMGSYLRERGPDHTGVWLGGSLGFVHSRLSIIDLDERSNQPMVSGDGKTVITFNGEIYNFSELKKELINQGVNFKTTSDTEVLLQGYITWGLEYLLGKINGMFAISILDKHVDKLYLIRDFFGKKPLYYFKGQKELIFASDIRVIHKKKKSKLTLDYESIDYYLSELTVPQPKTIWKEIKQVPPAHFLELNLSSNLVEIKKYWEINNTVQKDLSWEEVLNGSEEKLVAAIKRRSFADVPLGCFLSGGVDSGLVVSLLAQEKETAVNTYSFGLNYSHLNELPDAKIVADRYKTNHQEIILEANVLEDLPSLIEYMGEPFADSSLLPSYYVSKGISAHLKVALSGDGGDELFGGYNDYGLAYRTDEFVRNHPGQLDMKLVVVLDKILSRLGSNKENKGSFQHYSKLNGSDRLFRQMGFNISDKKELYFSTLLNKEKSFTSDYLDQLWSENVKGGYADTLMKASLKTRLLNDYLVKVDRSSMMNSLEVRSPFLDKELAEWAFSIPDHFKFKNGVNKAILKAIAQKHVDPDILIRPKRGFGIPLNEWLRDEMNDWMKDVLLGDTFKSRKLFSQKKIESLIEEHESGARHSNKLWALICLEFWFQKFVD